MATTTLEVGEAFSNSVLTEFERNFSALIVKIYSRGDAVFYSIDAIFD